MGQETLESLTTPPQITDPERCSGCGRCIAACPEKLFSLEIRGFRKQALINSAKKCTLCGKCINACPLEIIS